jgi:hypothetical protein
MEGRGNTKPIERNIEIRDNANEVSVNVFGYLPGESIESVVLDQSIS